MLSTPVFFNIGAILKNAPVALLMEVSTCRLNFILLLKITPRYLSSGDGSILVFLMVRETLLACLSVFRDLLPVWGVKKGKERGGCGRGCPHVIFSL